MSDLQMIRYHIDVSLGIDENKLIEYLESKTEQGMLAYEIAEITLKPHYQGWFMFRGTATQFRDNIKNHKDFKNRLKGKFSFSQKWNKEFDNPLNLPREEYFKRYMTKGKCIWMKNIDYKDYQKWEQEYKSIDQTKKNTIVKDPKTGKLNLNESLIGFIRAKLYKDENGNVAERLDPDSAYMYIIDWFGKNKKDLDDFIIIRKMNVVLLHFEKDEYIESNKSRIVDKYKSIHNY